MTVVGDARGEGIQLGVMAELPPYMFLSDQSEKDVNLQSKRNQDFFNENLSISARIGGQWNIVIAWQGIDGPDKYARLQRVVDEHRQRGLRVVIRLIEKATVYSDIRSPGFETVAHSGYMDWVKALASALSGKVDMYLIGNEMEINVANNYGWTPKSPKKLYVNYDEYRVLVASASRAIHEADPVALIANGGFSDKTLALAYASSLYHKNGMKAALEAWRRWKEISGDSIEGRFGLWRLLNADETKRRVTFLNDAIRNPVGEELFQLHYYGGWHAIPDLIDWLRQRMKIAGKIRPIVACEVGYRVLVNREQSKNGRHYWVPDLSHYSSTEHASEMVKSFSLFAGANVKRLLYWNMRLRKKRGMVAPLLGWSDSDIDTGQVPDAFRFMTSVINGASPAKNRISLQKGLWERHFTGINDVSVVWSEKPLHVALPSAAMGVYDIRGKAVTRGSSLVVDVIPQYIIWGNTK